MPLQFAQEPGLLTSYGKSPFIGILAVCRTVDKKYAPRDAELAQLEAEARKARVGLLSQPNPVPPWNSRHGEGVPQTAGVIGNRRSHVYHKAGCRSAASMAGKNRVIFASQAEAEKAGYRKSRDCW